MLKAIESSSTKHELVVRIQVVDGGEVMDREVVVEAARLVDAAVVKSLGDVMLRELVDEVKAWRSSPRSRGQLEVEF